MKILIIHNNYQQRGGEDAVVEAEAALLEAAGHEVQLEEVTNRSISGPAAKAQAFLNASYDVTRKAWLAKLVGNSRPDVVHVHNFFPLITPAVHEAAAELGLPVVQTLHNYRLLCANAQFLRNHSVCEKCLGGHRYWGIVHRCYRGSFAASLSVVRMQHRAATRGTWHKHVHCFIALTDFARQKFISGGLPADRIVVKPNFVFREVPRPQARAGALFVGRLSPEKGGELLLRAWQELDDIPLTIVGDGPESEKLKSMATANVHFAGQLPPDVVAHYMRTTQALIVPSIWYEGFPMTVVEAFASELPVIASDLGSLSEIIISGRNGAHFPPGDPKGLVKAVRGLFSNSRALDELGKNARADYENYYAPSINLKQLEEIYSKAIEVSHRI